MKKVILFLTAGMLLASCASKKQFTELKSNYNKLSTEYQTAQVQLAENRATIKSLEERLAECKGSTEKLLHKKESFPLLLRNIQCVRI